MLRSARNDGDGFTLMEVLVALVIFSIMAAGFSHYVSDRAKQTAYLTDKTLASIIASNTITQMQASGAWPVEGHTRQPVSLAEKDWLVDVNVLDTDQPMIRRLDVTVALAVVSQENRAAKPLFTLTGYLGKN